MRIITTMADLVTLAAAGCVPGPVLGLLKAEMETLAESYGRPNPRDLDLTLDGPLVLLEPGDNVRNLRHLGLDPRAGGLLGSSPERVRKFRLAGGIGVWQLAIVMNNEYVLTIFLISGQFGQEVERWLEDEIAPPDHDQEEQQHN